MRYLMHITLQIVSHRTPIL